MELSIQCACVVLITQRGNITFVNGGVLSADLFESHHFPVLLLTVSTLFGLLLHWFLWGVAMETTPAFVPTTTWIMDLTIHPNASMR